MQFDCLHECRPSRIVGPIVEPVLLEEQTAWNRSNRLRVRLPTQRIVAASVLNHTFL